MFLPWEFKLILSSYVNYLIKESKSFNPVIGGAILLRDNLIIVDNTLFYRSKDKESEAEAQQFKKTIIELCDANKSQYYAEASILLGLYYLEVEKYPKKDTDKKIQEVVTLFEKAARANHPWGKFCLGLLAYHYNLLRINGIKLINSAKNELPIAKTCVATLMNLVYYGQPGSNTRALRLINEALYQDEPFAIFLTGFNHHHGFERNIVNISNAVACYKKAASLGHVLAIFKLAEINEKGLNGYPMNRKEAIKLYKQVIAQGYNQTAYLFLTLHLLHDCLPPAMMPLNDLYRSYYTTAKNKVEYYEKLESETDSFFIGWKTRVGTISNLSHDIVNHIVDYAFAYPTLTIKDKILRTFKSRLP